MMRSACRCGSLLPLVAFGFLSLVVLCLGRPALPVGAQAGGTAPVTFTDVVTASRAVLWYNEPSVDSPVAAAHNQGVAWGDYDGDGWIDLYLTNNVVDIVPQVGQPEITCRLYRNLGNGTFVDRGTQAGVTPDDIGGGGAEFVDYDNDGDLDLHIAASGPDYLYRNQGNGTFKDVTPTAGVDDRGRGASGTWADYDADGHLDLYVANWDLCYDYNVNLLCSRRDGRDSLYHNNGDGTFTDVAERLLKTESHAAGGFIGGWADYDNDGDQDLYIVNDSRGQGPLETHVEYNVMYRNDGPGGPGGWIFTDVTVETNTSLTQPDTGRGPNGMGIAFGDLDRDGDLDFYTSDTDDTFLYKNQLTETGKPTFSDITMASGTRLRQWTWGPVIFDMDHDGWEDIYITAGWYKSLYPEALFWNRGNNKFINITTAAGVNDLEDNRSSGVADYDNDGDLDLYVPRYRTYYAGRTARTGGWAHLYRNNGPPRGEAKHWLMFSLQGVTANRQAVGARITLFPGDGQPTLIREATAGSGLGSTHDQRLHFGLGDLTVIPRVEVRWPPPSTQVDVLTNVPADRVWRIVEGKGIVGEHRPQPKGIFLPVAIKSTPRTR